MVKVINGTVSRPNNNNISFEEAWVSSVLLRSAFVMSGKGDHITFERDN